MNTRGDASGTIVPIGDMCKYSISNKNLDYGIRAKSIPWCQMGVLLHSDIRESRDEEMIGHLLAYQLLGKRVPPSGTALDRIYGMSRLSTGDEFYRQADDEIEKLGPDKVENQFLHVFDELRKTISSSAEQHFAKLIFGGSSHRVKWHYQAIFIAFFELIIQKRKQVADYTKLGDSLRRCALTTGIRDDWTSDVRYAAKEAIRSRIQDYFIDRGSEDPAIHSNHTKLENLLSYSRSEQEYYDFKMGFHRLDSSSTFDEGSLNKIIQTISAMANHGPKAIGRVLLGIADNEDDAKKWSSKYNTTYIQVGEHFVTGVDHEAKSYGGIDKYREFIKHRIDNSPITPSVMKKCIRIESWTYKGKEVLVLQIDSVSDATFYDNKLYIRQDSRLQELKTEEYKVVYRRFIVG
jgi:hypothetical protein